MTKLPKSEGLWVIEFWIFWKSAKCLKDTRVLFAQMDEKCFFAIVTRGSNKSISSLGIEPIAQTSHHKSYIHKVMGIVVTGFIPLDNDIEKGGRAIKISLERAERMKKETKNSYKRVYLSNGKFHYPAIPENVIRIRGQEYFHDMEVTRSNRGTLLDPKYNFLTNHRDIVIPAMEREAEKLSEGGTKKVIIRY